MAEDRVVIVTGAAHGIGLACVRRFIADGHRVVLADRDEEAGLEAADELGAQAMFVQCDVGSRLAVHNLVAETISGFGRVDVLVNNAGTMAKGDILSQTEEDFDRVLAVNLKGPFLLSQAVARQMVDQIKGSEERIRDLRRRYAIVNITTIDAQLALADQFAYTVSKGALEHLTRAAALALAPYHIRVNAVAPGAVNTAMMDDAADSKAVKERLLSHTPLGRFAEADEVAAVAAFLASPAASYVTGETVTVDGGRMALNAAPEPDE